MEASDGPVRLGIIGCGNVTQNRHLPAIHSLSDLQVVALADVDDDRLQQAADKYGIERRYSDYRALLDDQDVEAVAVCVPLGFHAETALAALDASKHVFIEKPLAPTVDEADALIRRAADSRCRIMVGYNKRWHRLVRQARVMIQEGRLGQIELVSSCFTAGTHYKRDVLEWKKRRAMGGGVLMEFATHYFDLWRFLLNTEVDEVHASTRSDQWDDVTGTITARLSNGGLVAAYFSEWTTERNETHIFGRSGSIHLSVYRFDGLEFVPLSTSTGQLRHRLAKVVDSVRRLPRAAVYFRSGGEYYASFVEQWRHFARSIRHGVPVECTLEDGLRALEVALAAVKSASIDRPVRVKEAPREITPLPQDLRADN
ncbi:MAG TPA: Gfo/Idh/MocA family oxidoreductase [Anaerolineae bacterium]|nr:Gfo/Idh/MocA family oxidoreductase [Anaerolineae bacterium]